MGTSKVIKNFISFRQYMRTKNLSVNEQYLIEFIFEYHNYELGYAYPDLKTLMAAFNTTSKNRVISTIKALEEKGLITVIRSTRDNNRYIIENINDFINVEGENKQNKVGVDSNGNKPLDGQVTVEEALEEIVTGEKVINLTPRGNYTSNNKKRFSNRKDNIERDYEAEEKALLSWFDDYDINLA